MKSGAVLDCGSGMTRVSQKVTPTFRMDAHFQGTQETFPSGGDNHARASGGGELPPQNDELAGFKLRC